MNWVIMNSEDKRILEVKIMQILMIEDNESVAEMMQMFFINEGWEREFYS